MLITGTLPLSSLSLRAYLHTDMNIAAKVCVISSSLKRYTQGIPRRQGEGRGRDRHREFKLYGMQSMRKEERRKKEGRKEVETITNGCGT